MAGIDINISRMAAIDRIITVMQARYADALDEVRDDDLFLPPPQRAAYYTSPEDPEADLTNRDPAVFLYATQPRVLIPGTAATAGPLVRSERRSFNLNVTLIFMASPPKSIIRNGKELTFAETMYLRAERYTGAMAQTIQKYACDGESIIRVTLVNDTPDLFFQGQRKIKGIATTSWSIEQKILMPNRAPLP